MDGAGATYRTSDFEYDLPPELIAQEPAERRGASRLLMVDRSSGELRHGRFEDVVELFAPGDVLVVNDTRVFPARLRGRRGGGGAAEILLLRPTAAEGEWIALVRPGAKLGVGKRVEIADGFAAEITGVETTGERRVRLLTEGPVQQAIERHGEIPLPPYVRREAGEADRERYQTVYARTTGSVAAPTAGLQFTAELLDRIQQRGVTLATLLLHVGIGTFRPVEHEDPSQHLMHSEWYEVTSEAAAAIRTARSAGGSVWAVGTTVVRTLETVAADTGEIRPGSGWTDIFIRPPYRFQAVDRLITNFHLPRSTLLMLVSALAGYELTMRAYREAVRERYRFFSYGDAMAIL